MKHGPVDVLLVAFGQPRPDGSIAAELRRLAQAGTIRVLDAMFVLKLEDGTSLKMDIEELPDSEREAFGFVETGVSKLFDSNDTETILEGMQPGSAILALAIEHTWAIKLRDSLEQAGASLAMDVRIPAVAVDDAYAVGAVR